jgi:hypothetical protein
VWHGSNQQLMNEWCTLYWRWRQVFGGKNMGEVCFALPYLPACLPLLISISV